MIAKIGDRILTAAASIVVLLMLLYSGYSLWDIWYGSHNIVKSSDLIEYKPVISEEDDDAISFEEILKLNEDVCGWITLDGTNIDYPIVQGTDDFEYINKDVFGNRSLGGAIYLSTQNKKDFSDVYSIIYGHNINGDQMFADLGKYRENSFFQTYSSGMLILPTGKHPLKVIACMNVDAYDRVVYIGPEKINQESVNTLKAYIQKNAVNKRELSDSNSSKILALSTCADAMSENRIVVFCQYE